MKKLLLSLLLLFGLQQTTVANGALEALSGSLVEASPRSIMFSYAKKIISITGNKTLGIILMIGCVKALSIMKNAVANYEARLRDLQASNDRLSQDYRSLLIRLNGIPVAQQVDQEEPELSYVGSSGNENIALARVVSRSGDGNSASRAESRGYMARLRQWIWSRTR